MQRLALPGWIGTLALCAAACDDGVADTAENAGRCQIICNAVDECTGQDNSTDCRQQCVEDAEDDAFEERVEECAECIGIDDGCEENAARCSATCAGVATLSAG